MSITFKEFDNFYKRFNIEPHNSDAPLEVMTEVYEYLNDLISSNVTTNNIYNELQSNLIFSNKDNIDKILMYYFLKFDELYHIQLCGNDIDYFGVILRTDINSDKDIRKFENTYKRFLEDCHKQTKLISLNILKYCDSYDINYKLLVNKIRNKTLIEIINTELRQESYSQTNPSNKYYWVNVEGFETDISELYNMLLKHNFIDDKTSLDNFKKFFAKEINEEFVPIIWKKSVASLLGFIKILKAYGNILPIRNDFTQIKRCFHLKEGKAIHNTKEVLATYYVDAESRAKRDWIILERIISEF